MAAAAESQFADSLSEVQSCAYARSSETLRRFGRCVLEHMVSTEALGIAEEAETDFTTATTENLATDSVMAECLDVARRREMAYRDGHVVAADGTPMAVLVRRGLAVSREAAGSDPRMSTQATRDKGDVHVADIVDSLRPGQVYMVVSMCPDEALAADRQFWRRFGYREGLSFVQTYYRTPDGGTVIASSFSVGASDHSAWSRVLQGYGIDISPGTHSAQWILHGYLRDATPAQAESLAGQVRDRYYEAAGVTQHRYSVNEFIEANRVTVQRYFDTYIRPLAEALASGKNNETLRGFARALMGSSAVDAFGPAIHNELMRVANMDSFSESSASVMENLIRYALVEELRTGLSGVVSGVEVSDQTPAMMYGALPATLDVIVNRIEGGVGAGRSYGGCASLELNTQGEPVGKEPANGVGDRQGAYGGKESWTWSIGVCRVKGCPSPNPTEVGPCKVCKRCQHLFDSGRDPSSVYGSAAASRKKAGGTAIRFFSKKPAMLAGANVDTGKTAVKPQSGQFSLLAA